MTIVEVRFGHVDLVHIFAVAVISTMAMEEYFPMLLLRPKFKTKINHKGMNHGVIGFRGVGVRTKRCRHNGVYSQKAPPDDTFLLRSPHGILLFRYFFCCLVASVIEVDVLKGIQRQFGCSLSFHHSAASKFTFCRSCSSPQSLSRMRSCCSLSCTK